jgi:hypothetical protein
MNRAVDSAVAAIAAARHGVFTRADVAGCGGSDQLIARRVDAGRWERVAPGVYRLAGAGASWRQRLATLVAAAGPDAVVSHEAAAGLQRLPGAPAGALVVTTPHSAHQRAPIGRIVQSTDLTAHDVELVEGLPVTSIPRTIVDLAARGRPQRLALLLEESLVDRRVTLPEVRAVFDRVSGRGKPGSRLMRSVLDELGAGAGVPESRLERLGLRILRDNGIRSPVLQHPHPGRVPGNSRTDGLYVPERVILEWDGRRCHERRRDMQLDRDRDNAAAAAGYVTLRFTWWTMRNDPLGMCDTLRSTLAVRRRRVAS